MGGRFCSLDQTNLACESTFSKDYVIPSPKLNEHQKEWSSPEIEVCFLPKLGEDKRVARNSQWGAMLGVWGRIPQLPEAIGGLEAKPLAAGDWESGGKAPSRRRQRDLGAEPPALENYAFFSKNNLILGLF